MVPKRQHNARGASKGESLPDLPEEGLRLLARMIVQQDEARPSCELDVQDGPREEIEQILDEPANSD